MTNIAPRATALFLKALVTRLYREKNTAGILRAFSDQPEHSGMSPLKNIMKELQLRKVHISPRFHEEVKGSLERRKADVIELYQPLTESMKDIHGAIAQCMTTTLAELKRSNATVRQQLAIKFKLLTPAFGYSLTLTI
jgi:DNA excision repair protein ERCC-4